MIEQWQIDEYNEKKADRKRRAREHSAKQPPKYPSKEYMREATRRSRERRRAEFAAMTPEEQFEHKYKYIEKQYLYYARKMAEYDEEKQKREAAKATAAENGAVWPETSENTEAAERPEEIADDGRADLDG